MNRSVDSAPQPGNPTYQQKLVAPLPSWKQLSSACQQEVVTVLVMMLIKRLAALHSVPQEVNDEPAC
jgi:hypothetical protein